MQFEESNLNIAQIDEQSILTSIVHTSTQLQHSSVGDALPALPAHAGVAGACRLLAQLRGWRRPTNHCVFFHNGPPAGPPPNRQLVDGRQTWTALVVAFVV